MNPEQKPSKPKTPKTPRKSPRQKMEEGLARRAAMKEAVKEKAARQAADAAAHATDGDPTQDATPATAAPTGPDTAAPAPQTSEEWDPSELGMAGGDPNDAPSPTPKKIRSRRQEAHNKAARKRAAKDLADWLVREAQDAAPPPTRDTAADTPPACVTNPLPLACLADLFLGDLEQAGKSRGTVFGYSIDLALAIKHFGGKEAPATVLTTESVAAFFESDALTMTRTGKAKAKPTKDKTRRVLRQVLTWGAEKGYLPPIEIPAQYLPRAKAE